MLPNGRAWAKHVKSNLYKLILGISIEFVRFEKRILDAYDEMDPRTASETLPEWEDVFQSRNNCGDKTAQTINERRSLLLQREASRGGSSAKYFIDAVSKLGFQAEIKNHNRFRVGSRTGQRLNNHDDWAFTWTLVLKEIVSYKFRAGSRAGERLKVFRDETIRCLIEREKQAHTHVNFEFI